MWGVDLGNCFGKMGSGRGDGSKSKWTSPSILVRIALITRNLVMITARDIVTNKSHPLYKAFLAFLGGKEPTLRQGRKFLAKYPQYKEEKGG